MDPRLHGISEAHGAFLRSEALDLGYDDRTIARLVSSGEWQRVRRGAYVPGNVWAGLEAAGRRLVVAKAAMRGVRCSAAVSHTTAADALGAAVWDMPDLVHLTRTDQRAGRSEAGLKQHRGLLLVGDLTFRDGLMVTSGTRTALDVTRIADVERSLVTMDDLLHQGETTPELLEEGLETMRFWPDTLTSDLVVRLADGRSESVAESRTRHLCWAQGLPAPVPQYEIRDRAGRVVARVDLAWPEIGVFLEFDGRVKYQRHLREGESVTDAVLREKRREEMIRELTGWRCIRLVWADLYHPERTAARIRAVLRSGRSAA